MTKRRSRSAETPAERTLEQRVAAVVARVAEDAPSGLDAPLELDSLSHAELVLALEDELGVRLPDQVSLGTVREAAEAARAGEERLRVPLTEGIGHLQWLAAGALRPVLGPYYRLTVSGTEHVPERGAVVIASNHDSLLDIPFVAMASPRRVWFMAKRELFEGRFGAWFFHVLGGFPVDRDRNDLAALRAALGVIERGLALGMYPEGTRSKEFLPFRAGAAWVALATGSPIVPVGISGTAEAMPTGSVLPRRSQVKVAFGEPIDPGREEDPRARLDRATEITVDLRREVDRLRAS